MAATAEWKHPVPRGAFIAVEGLDRAGKTTQVKRLCDKLYAQGHNIKTLRFPGNCSLYIRIVITEFYQSSIFSKWFPIISVALTKNV